MPRDAVSRTAHVGTVGKNGLINIPQLDKIIDLLGSPSEESLTGISDGARNHVLKQAHKPARHANLYQLSSAATQDAVHLLTSMLTFDYVSELFNPAPAAAGAAPPKNQGNPEARSAIYATAAVPIFDHVFFCSS